MKSIIQRITPNLWFDTHAVEAALFYVSIFQDSEVKRVTRYGKERHGLDGIEKESVMTVEFELDGQEFIALNGGPQYKFSEAISFVVNCYTQEEIDYYWEKLSEGGDEAAQVCGWLKDKYGVSWQIVPVFLSSMISDPDPEKSERVMKAMLQMEKKIDLGKLKAAYEGNI